MGSIPTSAKIKMQAAFGDHLFCFSRSRNPLPTASKLFLPAATATPRRRRIHCLSATNIPANHPDSVPIAALDDYQLLFSSQPSESIEPLSLLVTEGTLPADFPLGTYYLTGPGMIADSQGSTVNPLDGHGYLRAFRFIGEGAVMYSARYVETEAARDEREEETGKWRFRRPGLFSKIKSRWTSPVSNLLKNVANTAVLSWGGRLFCLWDGGHPYELEPTTLVTIGPADLIMMVEGRQKGGSGGVLNLAAGITKPLLHVLMGKPPKRTLSHYKIDARRKMLLLLSCDVEDTLLPQTNFTFYEFDSNFVLKKKRKFIIPDQLLIHDWAFTDSHYIIMGNRIKLDVPATFLAMTSLAPVMSAISLNTGHPTTPIYLLPRCSDDTAPGREWRIPIGAPSQVWTTHMGNAYEEKDGAGGNIEIKIQASVCSYQWFNFKKMFGYSGESSKLDPSFMNLGRQELPHLVQMVEDHACGAPLPILQTIGEDLLIFQLSIPPTLANQIDSLIKLDCSNGLVKSWRTKSRMFIGEPMFISKRVQGEEDDGYIVVVEYAVSKKKCHLVVLDAKKIGVDDAVVVKLEVPQHLTFPFGFHGIWDTK